jgi:hypothetical protein
MRGSFPEGLGLQQVVDIYKRSIGWSGCPAAWSLGREQQSSYLVPRPHIGSMVQKTERPQDPCSNIGTLSSPCADFCGARISGP